MHLEPYERDLLSLDASEAVMVLSNVGGPTALSNAEGQQVLNNHDLATLMWGRALSPPVGGDKPLPYDTPAI